MNNSNQTCANQNSNTCLYTHVPNYRDIMQNENPLSCTDIDLKTASCEPKYCAKKTNDNMTISGRILDQNGQPLMGVNILVNGTTKGTVTDYNGNYSLDDVRPLELVKFSYMGLVGEQYKAYDIPKNLTMKESTEKLPEVVIVGKKTQKINWWLWGGIGLGVLTLIALTKNDKAQVVNVKL